MLTCDKFMVEYRINPIGLDNIKPRFSWQINSDIKENGQSAYRVIVSNNNEIVWDTKKKKSSQSILLEYDGKELNPFTKYDVNLEVWDRFGKNVQARSSFETGLMSPSNITAKWISYDGNYKEDASPVFKKTFRPSGEIKSARIYATALGIYEIEINGKRISDEYFAPGWTSYQTRLQYQTYDATNILKENNEIRAIVGNGWYKNFRALNSDSFAYGKRSAFLMEMHVEYMDNTKEILISDESWKWGTGEVRYSDLYNGEIIDKTYKEGSWQPVEIYDYKKNNIIAQECEPVRITKTLQAKQLIKTPKGEMVIDFGQNLTGYIRLKVKRNKGTKIIIKHAEVLDKEGNFYTENLRKAKATDTFICSGQEDIFMPHFTFHGFRYIQIDGMGEDFDINQFQACVLHSDIEETGSFECSHELVNQLQHNIQWGQRGNFLDIPTDCPQRDERLGWTGDVQVFARTSAYNMNVSLFMSKWLRDLAADQNKTGSVPHVIPNALGDKNDERCSAAWGDAAVIVPWTMYLCYGDKNILETQFDSMKAWVEYIRKQAGQSLLWKGGTHYGDWLGLDMEQFYMTNNGAGRTRGFTDMDYIATAFFAYSTELLAKAADVLGYEKDKVEYNKLHSQIIKAFQKEYVTPNGRLVSETQTGILLALMFNLVQQKHRKNLAGLLRKNIENHEIHMVAGFVGSSYMCPVLSEMGMHDMAGQLLLQKEYPSWLYPVTKGATTIWERWNGIKPDGEFATPEMNSFNHYAYGAIGDWMYRRLLGIDLIEPGYKKILIAPMPIKGIENARGELKTQYGKIGCNWIIEDGIFTVEAQIPFNCTAIVKLPGGESEQVGSGTHTFSQEYVIT